MKKISKLFTKIAAALLAGLFICSTNVSALTLQEGAEAARGTNMPSDLLVSFRNITDTVLMVVGAIAVIMMIIGGIRYILSGGDAKKVTDAKNTILYAIIGLLIIIFSYAIVHFVIGILPKDQETEQQAALLLMRAVNG